MQLDEELIDSRDLERDVKQKDASLSDREDEIATGRPRDLDREHRPELMRSIQLILERKNVDVTQLRLPQRETLALETLQAAVNGRKTHLGTFVYAEDRRSMLEQALAILQPALTSGDESLMADLGADLQALTKHVSELRATLIDLEDSQDELMAERRPLTAKADPDTADKPAPVSTDPDAPRPPTSLNGPERAEAKKVPSTLTGADAKRETAVSTLSAGPEVVEAPALPTTLGDASEIAEAVKKKPWWRRPFG